MIQILGIREFFSKKENAFIKTDAFYDRHWRAESIEFLLNNWGEFVGQIAEEDRYNLFFTSFECTEKKREMKLQRVLGFDIDDIGEKEHYSSYLPLISSVLQVDSQKLTVIGTGHGLLFFFFLTEPFTSEEYFAEHKVQYNAICDKLNHAFKEASLQGQADRDFFKPKLLGFRLPGTLNKKKGLPEREVRLLQWKGEARPHSWNWEAISGLKTVKPTEHLPQEDTEYPKPDTKAVLTGCAFLQHCKNSPEMVREPEWYAMLSVLGRLENGEQLAHEYSAGHPTYDPNSTARKLQQALASSGPRTCDNIDQLWGGCHTCPNYKKVTSPILIHGPDYIETETTGFHKVIGKGKSKTRKPIYEDLRRYFEREHSYRVVAQSGLCYTYNGTHFELMNKNMLENFAQTHFKPDATTALTKEFQQLVCRTNLIDEEWFNETTHKKINLKNGVYDLETGNLLPHSIEYGFRYVLPYEYDAKATAPLFRKFLNDVTCNDFDLQNLLLEYAGYCFSGDDCWTGKVLVLVGEGSNGKSTFLDVLRALAGRDNYSSLTMSDLRKDTNLTMIEGKLFNLAEETPKNSLVEPAYLKNIVTGGEMKIKHLYHQPYAVKNKTKFIFACNELPQSEDSTEGFFRRFLLVPFNATFSEERENVDTEILKKLKGELPGILNLFMEGYRRLSQHKRFTKSLAARQTLHNYRMEIDKIASWAGDNLIVGHNKNSDKYTVLNDIYQRYRTDAERMGFQPENSIVFGRKLAKIIPDLKSRTIQKKIAGKNHRVVADVVLEGSSERGTGNVTDLFPAI